MASLFTYSLITGSINSLEPLYKLGSVDSSLTLADLKTFQIRVLCIRSIYENYIFTDGNFTFFVYH